MTWGKAILVGVAAGICYALGEKFVNVAWERAFGK